MPAPKGNQFWKFRTRSGPKQIWSDPIKLWEECLLYFQWCEDNPLKKAKTFHSAGIVTKTTVSKMRAMTIKGLCFYLKISYDAWVDYRKDKDLSKVIHEAEQVIYDQKFSGAAANLLNANIISRDLGLANKQNIEITDESEIKTSEEVLRRFAFMLRNKKESTQGG